MLSLIRVITAAAIQVHAAFGCCAHDWRHSVEHASLQHEPSECEQNCRRDHDVATFAVSQCDGCLGASHEHAPHPCRHANCNWSATDARNIGSLAQQKLEHTPAHRVGAELFVLDRDMATVRASWEINLSHAPPVRSHLANCVLLI